MIQQCRCIPGTRTADPLDGRQMVNPLDQRDYIVSQNAGAQHTLIWLIGGCEDSPTYQCLAQAVVYQAWRFFEAGEDLNCFSLTANRLATCHKQEFVLPIRVAIQWQYSLHFTEGQGSSALLHFTLLLEWPGGQSCRTREYHIQPAR